MTKANILNGWRDPNEKPVDGVNLLVVLQDNDNKAYVVQLEREGLDHARSHEDFTVVAWQYCPMWVTGMIMRNSVRGWRSPSEYPIFNVRVLIARKNFEDNTDIISIVNINELDNFLCYGALLAWQYCPIWESE